MPAGAIQTPLDRGASAPPRRTHATTAGAELALAEFMTTMPRRYLERFDEAAIREHAIVASERQGKPAHVGLFSTEGGGGPGLCVVAPDALGLLAAISASLMLEGFDITDAEAYTRRTLDGRFEAVDLFWVRRAEAHEPGALTDVEARTIGLTLNEVLTTGSPDRPRRRRASRDTPGAAETRVHFVDHDCEPHLTLELETNDRPGLLYAVTTALFAESVLITSSRITTRGHRVHDSFDLVESDGSPLSGIRLQRIELAVLAAVDSPP